MLPYCGVLMFYTGAGGSAVWDPKSMRPGGALVASILRYSTVVARRPLLILFPDKTR